MNFVKRIFHYDKVILTMLMAVCKKSIQKLLMVIIKASKTCFFSYKFDHHLY